MLWMFYGMVGEGMGGKEIGRGGEGDRSGERRGNL